MNNKFLLNEKIALITGGAGLLGEQHAAALLELGATVIIADINVSLAEKIRENLKKLFPAGKIYSRNMDVTDLKSIHSVAEDIRANIGKVSILINNASIDHKVDQTRNILNASRLENLTLTQWNTEIAVGLTGAFLCSQVFGTEMALQKKGVILNIASDLSVFSPDQRLYRQENLNPEQQPVKPLTYSVIKTGLIGLTRYLATYWADQGVRANALSPGGIFQNQDAVFVKRLENLIPMGRMAFVDEYRGAIQFLCSDASLYLTGQNIVMDGGRSVL